MTKSKAMEPATSVRMAVLGQGGCWKNAGSEKEPSSHLGSEEPRNPQPWECGVRCCFPGPDTGRRPVWIGDPKHSARQGPAASARQSATRHCRLRAGPETVHPSPPPLLGPGPGVHSSSPSAGTRRGTVQKNRQPKSEDGRGWRGRLPERPGRPRGAQRSSLTTSPLHTQHSRTTRMHPAVTART